MTNPLNLITSVYAFDRIAGTRANELQAERDGDELLEIGAIRLALGFDSLPTEQPLRTTRQVQTGLSIMVWHDDSEAFYPWILVERDESHLAIVPLFKEDNARFEEFSPGDLLYARFWREGDTEYRFSSEILALDSPSLTLKLRHADSIERLQQRDFYRLDIQFDIAFVVEAKKNEENEEDAETILEDLAGQYISGKVLNLSAGGLSALGEQALPGNLLLRIDPACMHPFPLGGVLCEIVQDSGTDNCKPLQLSFIDLPPERERELVRCIYQYQTNSQAARNNDSPTIE